MTPKWRHKQTIRNYNTNCRVIKIKYGHDGLNMTIVRVYTNGFIFPYAEKKVSGGSLKKKSRRFSLKEKMKKE